MPDLTATESSSDWGGYRTPRPGDLRWLKLGRRGQASPPPRRAEDATAPGERPTSGPPATAGGWVEPGEQRPQASEPGWVDPRNRQEESGDDSDQAPWQRMFGGAGAQSDATQLGKPPNHFKRLFAYIIDSSIIVAVLSAVFPAILSQPYLDLDPWIAWIQEAINQAELAQGTGADSVQTPVRAPDSSPIRFLALDMATGIVVAVYILYHGVLLGLLGATVGKRLMGITVYGPDGLQIGIPRAVVRSIGFYLTDTILVIGFIIVLFHPRRRALHDIVAGSYPVERAQSFERVDQT